MRAVICLLLILSSYCVDANATDTSMPPHSDRPGDRDGRYHDHDKNDMDSTSWASVIVTIVLVIVIIIGLCSCAQWGTPCDSCAGGAWMRRCDPSPNVMQGVKIVCGGNTYKPGTAYGQIPEAEPLIFATAPVQPAGGWNAQPSGWRG